MFILRLLLRRSCRATAPSPPTTGGPARAATSSSSATTGTSPTPPAGTRRELQSCAFMCVRARVRACVCVRWL